MVARLEGGQTLVLGPRDVTIRLDPDSVDWTGVPFTTYAVWRCQVVFIDALTLLSGRRLSLADGTLTLPNGGVL